MNYEFDKQQGDFIFKNMSGKTKTTLTICDTCQKCKYNTHPLHGETSVMKYKGKSDLIAVDLIGPLNKGKGVYYIFIVLVTITKFVKLL